LASQVAQSNEKRAHVAWIGWVTLAGLILLAGAWLFFATLTPQSKAGAAPAPSSSNSDTGLRVRSDAWLLPDEELLGFVSVPAGPFLMGSDKATDPLAFDNERWSADRPQGMVDLPAFYIGRYEVTVRQFKAFVDATQYRTDAQTLQAPLDYPVANISWPDALAYCRWLERVMKESPATPSALRRLLDEGWRIDLPSEAQWEKAARGADGRIFPWGNVPRRERANYGGTSPAAVGSFGCPECPFGLSDLSGNVWEWTRSPYQAYPFDPADDGQGLEADALWVMRGGSFSDPERNVRAAVRGGADPGVRRPFIGFRVVLRPPGGQMGV
jgi:formylglycine-generating enzyme required for sulfatase activity